MGRQLNGGRSASRRQRLASSVAALLLLRCLWLAATLGWNAGPVGGRRRAVNLIQERADQRFAPAREALRGVAAVDYLSERRADIADTRYVTAQYAAAPVLLEAGETHALVLVDADDDAAAARLAARQGLRVRRRLDEGLLIAAREVRP